MPGKKTYRTGHPHEAVRSLEGIRQRMGWSQGRMAKAIGVPFHTYQKWIYTDQRPRHAAALLARAEAIAPQRRANCWEILRCGREAGGSKAHLAGPCPAAVDASADGVNSGTRGGRVCWAISGTFCGMQVEGAKASKLISCFSCDFFTRVLQEEGLANFKLLKPGQAYTQA